MFTLRRYLARSLAHHWRTHAAVALATATAVAVLAGALLVGASMRASLRDLALRRIGPVDVAVAAPAFARAALADGLQAALRGEPLPDSATSAPHTSASLTPDSATAASPAATAAAARVLPAANAPTAAVVCPAIVVSGSVVNPRTGARTGHAQVIAAEPARVEALFGSEAQDAVPAADADEAVLGAALAREIGAQVGDDVLVRVEKPNAVGAETFLGRRDANVVTLRLTVARVLGASDPFSGFSLAPVSHEVLNVFVPLALAQRRLEQAGRANTFLVAGASAAGTTSALARSFDLDDLGLALRTVTADGPDAPAPPGYLSLESSQVFLPPYVADLTTTTAVHLDWRAEPTLAYLATELRVGDRAIPYGVVAGVPVGATAADRSYTSYSTATQPSAPPPGGIYLTAVAAADLSARVGDRVAVSYLAPADGGGLAERTTTRTLVAIVPMTPPWDDRHLTPDFPGIADAKSMSDWDPPFSIDMKKIRQADEDYWRDHRATPRAFLALADARHLWGNRYGSLTTIRVRRGWDDASDGVNGTAALDAGAVRTALRQAIDPARAGLRTLPVRAQALAASAGSSDFGGLFVGFSFFLLISAAALIQVLYRLGVEGRAREWGLLRAVGFAPRRLRRVALAEGAAVAALGAAAGAAGAVLYARLLVHGLNTWWVGAIGAPFMRLAVAPGELVGGAFGGWLVAVLTIWFSIRRIARQPVRRLLAGEAEAGAFESPATPASNSATDAAQASARSHSPNPRRRTLWLALAMLTLGAALAAGAATRPAGERPGWFFGAAAAWLVATQALFAAWLRRRPAPDTDVPHLTLARVGAAAARRAPGRSLMVATLVASATFLVVAVGANRQTPPRAGDLHSGTGGFALLAESNAALYRDPVAAALALGADRAALAGVRAYSLRVRDGDDASCLNPFQALEPKVLGVGRDFIARGGFAFGATLAATPAEKANPWLLLDRTEPDGAVPVIGDANTVQWLLHKGLGDTLAVGGRTLRFVAMLDGSVYQSALLMAEDRFVASYPTISGWRAFALTVAPVDPAPSAAAAQALEAALEDQGFDAVRADERLAALMAVENTYLQTFESLGALGLLLGTVGLALALARNLLERRRELALLRALGFRARSLVWMTVAENLVLLAVGAGSGALCAAAALVPAAAGSAAQAPWGALALLLATIVASGALASATAAALVVRLPMLASLKQERT